jgi:ATP-dependent Clp protease ATP-binding subunit ClpA
MLVAMSARIAVSCAITEARRTRKAMVDTGDLLVGVTVSRDTVVREVCAELGIDLSGVRRVLEAGRRDVDAHPPTGGVPVVTRQYATRRRRIHTRPPVAFSAAARRVLGRAFTHARAHGARRLAAGHLLLAIAAQASGDPARRALAELGVDADALARAVCRRLRTMQPSCDAHVRDPAAGSASRRSGSR